MQKICISPNSSTWKMPWQSGQFPSWHSSETPVSTWGSSPGAYSVRSTPRSSMYRLGTIRPVYRFSSLHVFLWQMIPLVAANLLSGLNGREPPRSYPLDSCFSDQLDNVRLGKLQAAFHSSEALCGGQQLRSLQRQHGSSGNTGAIAGARRNTRSRIRLMRMKLLRNHR